LFPCVCVISEIETPSVVRKCVRQCACVCSVFAVVCVFGVCGSIFTLGLRSVFSSRDNPSLRTESPYEDIHHPAGNGCVCVCVWCICTRLFYGLCVCVVPSLVCACLAVSGAYAAPLNLPVPTGTEPFPGWPAGIPHPRAGVDQKADMKLAFPPGMSAFQT